jgi:RNA polymerase sigma-70 factor (ECF subfamily)
MASAQDTWSDRSQALADALARVALGDRAAFASLYRATSAHLFGVILRINPDRAQAEDILQEIFVNIWRAAQGFDVARSQPLTWLTSIARNRAIDSLRRRKTEISTVSTQRASDEDADLLDAMPSDDAGPLELLTRAAQVRQIAHCMDQLSAEQKQCVALAYYQGLSHAEVAHNLAQPLGTVKSWVRRALIALKDCLDGASAGRPVKV